MSKHTKSVFLTYNEISNCNGKNTRRVHKKYPFLKNNSHLVQKFDVFKPGKKDAVIIFCGKNKVNVDYFKTSGTFTELLEHVNQTLILVNWPRYAYVPELSYAFIEDLCLSLGVKSVKLVGTSYGGYCALELIADIKKNRVPIKVKGLVCIVSPFSFADIRLPTRIIIGATRFAGYLLKCGIHNFRFMPTKTTFSLGKRLDKRSLLTNIPALIITTSGFDLFVNNVRSGEKMRDIFDHVEMLKVRGEPYYRKYSPLLKKINIQGAHGVYHEDIPLMRKTLVKFLAH